MEFSVPHRFSQGFDGHYGLIITEVAEDLVRGEVAIGPQHLQPAGLVHGGLYAAVAETLASTGTYLVVSEQGQTAQGLANLTSFMRPITGGTLHATARRLHRGRTTWVWDVDAFDDEQRLCATTRMTVAVR
jgi:1,4-dihydroxy-2-naphthoyl-CoA hydrolase